MSTIISSTKKNCSLMLAVLHKVIGIRTNYYPDAGINCIR